MKVILSYVLYNKLWKLRIGSHKILSSQRKQKIKSSANLNNKTIFTRRNESLRIPRVVGPVRNRVQSLLRKISTVFDQSRIRQDELSHIHNNYLQWVGVFIAQSNTQSTLVRVEDFTNYGTSADVFMLTCHNDRTTLRPRSSTDCKGRSYYVLEFTKPYHSTVL